GKLIGFVWHKSTPATGIDNAYDHCVFSSLQYPCRYLIPARRILIGSMPGIHTVYKYRVSIYDPAHLEFYLLAYHPFRHFYIFSEPHHTIYLSHWFVRPVSWYFHSGPVTVVQLRGVP